MVFSSLIFIWMFLPIVFIGYIVLPDRFKNLILLLVSLIFYAWGEPRYIILMICSIIINYVIGLLMDRHETKKKQLLIIGIIINIAILGYFKYFNFLIDIINLFIKQDLTLLDISLPIGISFFTFQILSYIIDLYRGQYKAQKNIISLSLYISFFPQLIAGPIVRYKDINEQLNNRQQTLEQIAAGIRRFIYGLGKKVIIANTVAQCVDKIYAIDCTGISGVTAWVGAMCYMLQIYYDFSGYSDMAIGLGRMFGFEFMENFNYPYLSTSIQEFWQRWHISLGTWFREYLYIPLGGNRKGLKRTYINLLIVFIATGLWHGASFNFVLWGLYHGILLIIERVGLSNILKRHKVVAHLYVLIAVIFGWVLFRAEGLTQAIGIIRRMLLPWMYKEDALVIGAIFQNKTLLIILIGIVGSGVIQYVGKKFGFAKKWENSYLEIIYCTMVFVLCIVMLAGNTYNPFIYFRF